MVVRYYHRPADLSFRRGQVEHLVGHLGCLLLGLLLEFDDVGWYDQGEVRRLVGLAGRVKHLGVRVLLLSVRLAGCLHRSAQLNAFSLWLRRRDILRVPERRE